MTTNLAGHNPATIEAAIAFLKEAGIEARYEHTGGNVWCILVRDPRGLTYPGQPDVPADVYFGTAGGTWGWSDEFGQEYGDWTLPPVCDGDELGARIREVIFGDLRPA